MILGFPRAKQGLCHTKHGGAGGIILWALLTVFLVLLESGLDYYIFVVLRKLNENNLSLSLSLSLSQPFGPVTSLIVNIKILFIKLAALMISFLLNIQYSPIGESLYMLCGLWENLRSHLSIFSSPEPKAQESFSDQNFWCCPSLSSSLS